MKADPGQVGLEILLREIDKLTAVSANRLPAALFAGPSSSSGAAMTPRKGPGVTGPVRISPPA